MSGGNFLEYLPFHIFSVSLQENSWMILTTFRQLDAAKTLEDLKNPPGNKLEALKGDRSEQMSIMINQRWRICLRWDDGKAFQVHIVDYH